MYAELVLFLTLSVYSHGSPMGPEFTLPQQIPVTILLGKRLKLSVENAAAYSSLRWRFNDGPPSEKCEATRTDTVSILICPNMDYSDAGLYEYQAIGKDGQMEILLAVKAEVAECAEDLTAKQLAESTECYCSGITDQCHMAHDLFRSQIVVNVSEKNLVDLKFTSEGMGGFWDISEQESCIYYSLPRELTGNLLKSYGGFLDFPTYDDEIDAGSPDAMLKGKNYALLYYNLRELGSEELTRTTIKMTELNWRLLNGEPASRSIFMNVLSSVEAFYVKFNQWMEPRNIVLDSGESIDHGLGKVGTVEECQCRKGYDGMSCETCAQGYYRRHAVDVHGLCVSIKEKLKTWSAAEEKRVRIKTLLQSMKN